MTKESPEFTVNERRKGFPDEQATVNSSLLNTGQMVSEALIRQQARLGGKNLAEYFDGREGQAVAKSTISRWISEPRRFPHVFALTLAELDPEFGREQLRIWVARLAGSDRVLLESDPAAAAVVAAAREEALRRILYGPGGRGESYS